MTANNVLRGKIKPESDEDVVTSYNIDVVRTYLAQLVIVSHVALALFGLPLVPGRFAIWGFFIVSGYLNALSFQKSLDNGSLRNSIPHYYAKRIRRIYPMLLFSCLVVSLLSGQLLNADLKILLPVAYFYNHDLLNGVLWTLALELQFYFLTPLLLIGITRTNTRINTRDLLFSCAALTYLIPFVHVVVMGSTWYLDDRTAVGNLGFYLFGMILALRRQDALQLWRGTSQWILPVLGLYACTFFWFFNSHKSSWEVTLLLGQPLTLLAGLAIISAGVRFHPAWATVYGFLGYYTYEIYVLHGLGNFLLKRVDVTNDALLHLFFSWLLPMLVVVAIHLLRQATTLLRLRHRAP